MWWCRYAQRVLNALRGLSAAHAHRPSAQPHGPATLMGPEKRLYVPQRPVRVSNKEGGAIHTLHTLAGEIFSSDLNSKNIQNTWIRYP